MILTSESAPLSAPGHLNVTYSWQRLCTTKEQTIRKNKWWKETTRNLFNWRWTAAVNSDSTAAAAIVEWILKLPFSTHFDIEILAFQIPYRVTTSKKMNKIKERKGKYQHFFQQQKKQQCLLQVIKMEGKWIATVFNVQVHTRDR